MSEITVYHYAKCSTCREAVTMLRELNVPFFARDHFAEPLSATEIGALCRYGNISVSELLSPRSRAYRELGLAGKALTNEETIQLLATHPALIRRPLIVHDRLITIGFDKAAIGAIASAAAQKEGQLGT